MERKPGSFIITDDGGLAPNPDDYAMSKRQKTNYAETEGPVPDLRTEQSGVVESGLSPKKKGGK